MYKDFVWKYRLKVIIYCVKTTFLYYGVVKVGDY